MAGPVTVLFMLWLVWSTGSLAAHGTPLDRLLLIDGSPEDMDTQPGGGILGRGGSKHPLEPTQTQDPSILITPAPVLRTSTLAAKSRLQGRQDPPDRPDDPGVGVPLDPAARSVSSALTSSANSRLSEASLQFQGRLAALSSVSSADVQSARGAGIAEGSSSASSSADAAAATAIASAEDEAAAASSQAAGFSNSLASVLAGVTSASIVASIEASASSAVEAVQASASSSVQSAIDAARASFSAAATDNANDAADQSSELTPGQIGGIIVAVIIVSSGLSVLFTLLTIRYRRRKAEGVLNSDLRPESARPLARPAFNIPRNDFLSPAYNATVTAGRKPLPDFPPDMRQRTPPPSGVRPTMTPARPLSFTATPPPSGLRDPIPPLTNIARSNNLGQDAPPGFGLGVYDMGPMSPATTTDTSEAPPVKFSLARKQSISGGRRVQLVRVGSQQSGVLHRMLSNGSTERAPSPMATSLDTYPGADADADIDTITHIEQAERRRDAERGNTISTLTASSAILPTTHMPAEPSSNATNLADVKLHGPLAMNPVQLRPATETSFSHSDEDENEDEDDMHIAEPARHITSNSTSLLTTRPQGNRAGSTAATLFRSQPQPQPLPQHPHPHPQAPIPVSHFSTSSPSTDPNPEPSPVSPPPPPPSLPPPRTPPALQVQAPIPRRPAQLAPLSLSLSLDPRTTPPRRGAFTLFPRVGDAGGSPGWGR